MLTIEEIKMFIDEDAASVKKHFARIGERYFDETDVIRTSDLTEADNSDDIVRDIWSIDKL